MSQSVLFAIGGVVSFVVFGGLFVYGILTLKRIDRDEIASQ